MLKKGAKQNFVLRPKKVFIIDLNIFISTNIFPKQRF